MSWTPQQNEAINAVRAWHKNKRSAQVFRLLGFAGTGKTTIAKTIAQSIEGTVLYACYTGKASLVLRQKGCEGAGTIHGLIYRVEENPATGKPDFILNPESPLSVAKLLIVDEVSMVDEELARDLLSFGIKVLVLGDPEQLHPVKGAGYFIGPNPDFMLTEIHRQAADNPIIRMSMDVREGRRLEIGRYGDSMVIPRSKLGRSMVMAADQVLVGRNTTRRGTNSKIRSLLNRAGPLPEPGDRLVCLRNNREKKLLNGGLWTMGTMKEAKNADTVTFDALSQDDPVLTFPIEMTVPTAFFHGKEDELDRNFRRDHDEFDYGYALTVHKSQGSQWNNVIVIDESRVFREDAKRHLYTAITRAAERVTVVV